MFVADVLEVFPKMERWAADTPALETAFVVTESVETESLGLCCRDAPLLLVEKEGVPMVVTPTRCSGGVLFCMFVSVEGLGFRYVKKQGLRPFWPGSETPRPVCVNIRKWGLRPRIYPEPRLNDIQPGLVIRFLTVKKKSKYVENKASNLENSFYSW